jgi:hypothetical protein
MPEAEEKKFPPAYPHKPIKQIADDLFMARGSIQFNRFVRLSRNMAIVRSGTELTLINPIRLNTRGLRALDALGAVKHVIRLGAGHGSDDPFYVARYKALFWCQEGGLRYREPKIDRVLTEGGELPFGGARLLSFSAAKFPEAALVLTAGKGVLLTCDSVQHYGDYSNNNLVARLVMPFIGFPKTTIVGPIWLRAATPEGGSLRPDFERLLEQKFDALLAAHGTLLKAGARDAVARAVAKAFPA